VFRKEIVKSDDLAVLRSHGREVVALQACHPRFFATHRYIVWATPVLVTPRGGRSYRPDGDRAATAGAAKPRAPAARGPSSN